MRCNKKTYVPCALLVSVVLVAALTIITSSLFSAPQRIQLTPPPADATAISFFALGDQGSGDFRQWNVARSMEREAEASGDLDFVILLGDNFYPHGVDSIRDMQWNWKFENMYSGRKMATLPFYAVLGNHDVEGNGEAQIEYSIKQAGSGRWQMPGHYYSKDFGSDNGHPLLRIIFLDSNQLAPDDLQKQIGLIEETFSEAAEQATWRIVVAHHPIRNFGKHGETAAWLVKLLPVLKKYHVDLYLAGHDHDQQFIVHDGEPYYVVSGGGGKSLYDVHDQKKGLLFSRSQYGFSKIMVDSSRMQIIFFDEDGDRTARYAVGRKCSGAASVCLKNAAPSTDDKK